MEITKTLYVKDRVAWRKWLAKHHQTATEIWLIYYKKHTGKARIPYDDAVEEALCYGWIDSIVKRVDEEKFVQRFTPRKDNSNWSESNKKRIKKLIAAGQMTEYGLKTVDLNLINSNDEKRADKVKRILVVPDFFQKALDDNKSAKEYFAQLAPSYRQDYLHWVTQAKREETRQRRLQAAIERLNKNLKLGMK